MTDTILPSRRKRFARRAVLALAVVVLLLGWYVGAWLAVSRAAHDNWIRYPTAETAHWAFEPIVRYCHTDYLGADALCDLWWTINPPIVLPTDRGPRDFIAGNCWPLAPPESPDY